MDKNKHQKIFMVFIRSTILWVVVLGLIPVYMIVGYILFAVNAKSRHKVLATWGRLFTFISKYICGVKYIVKGQEHLPKTPSIIASNHQSTWETFGYVGIFPQHVWILKRELIRLPFFGWTLATASPIAINRSDKVGATQQILSQSVKRIAKGFWILVFPEGTRVAPGIVAPFKAGVARMALALKTPIVPVAVNSGYCMPRSSYMVYPGVVEVVIDKPITPQNDETVEHLTARIEKTIRHNLAKLSR